MKLLAAANRQKKAKPRLVELADKKFIALGLAASALILILSAMLVYFFLQSNSLKSELAALTEKQLQSGKQIEKLQADYAALSAARQQTLLQLSKSNSDLSSANANILSLNSQLAKKEQELSESKQNLESQKQQVQSIAADLGSLEKSLNDSFSWFKGNAQLPSDYGWRADIFRTRVLDDCIDNGKLNLACISYDMENTAFAIHYRTDKQSNNKNDFLQSVVQTIDSGWGDCEDYSLIFKATLNTIKQASPNVSAVAFAPGGTTDFRVYPKESTPQENVDRYWYVPNAHGVSLGTLANSYFYEICFRSSQTSGHCTVAISPEKISSSSELGKLMGAQVFEPQNGLYLGSVGSEFGICDAPSCVNQLQDISLVITDSELYKYEGGKWVGYSDYLKQVKAAKAGLLG